MRGQHYLYIYQVDLSVLFKKSVILYFEFERLPLSRHINSHAKMKMTAYVTRNTLYKQIKFENKPHFTAQHFDWSIYQS